MFHNLYICSCITCCLIVYNYLYYHALCGAFSKIKSFKSFKVSNREIPTYPEIEGTFLINIHHI